MRECGVCGQRVVIDDADTPLISRNRPVAAIKDAIDHVKRHPSNNEREQFELEYVFGTGYYPDDRTHWIDISDFPERHWGGALLDVQSRLAERGLMVNSLDMSLPPYADVIDGDAEEFGPALHVVGANWYTERLPDGGRDE